MSENTYTMNEQLAVSTIAAQDIEAYLRSLPETISVVNVEDDPIYRKKDVDLLWNYKKDGVIHEKMVEIKGDRYHRTGNMFVETISNMTKNTPGCFLYTEADYIFYYFVETKELNILHMKNFKPWFAKNQKRFTPKYLSTKVSSRSNATYRSKGHLVPKEVLREELGMKYFTIPTTQSEKLA